MLRSIGAFRQRRPQNALACAACAVVFSTRLHAQVPDTTLAPKDIDEAIAWGTQGNPAPYLLHYRGRPGRVNVVIVGAVYTPFLRVALAAKFAREAGRSFTHNDVSPNLIEPLAYVALRWYCCDPDRADPANFDPWTPFDYQIAVPGDRVLRLMPGHHVTASPMWITRDVSLLESFGGKLPYRDVVLVAAYPMSVLSTMCDFVIYRELHSQADPGDVTTELRIGRVTPEDLTRWR
jgi:hypothetical protein